jgi:exoribonuclease-2
MPRNSRRIDLAELAAQIMTDRGLEPDFSPAALSQAASLAMPDRASGPGVRDLTGMDWASIDNDDSRDLDQLTVSEALPDGRVRVYVAVSDVDASIDRGTPIDDHARTNTTSVYTPGMVFPMLPERCSYDLTSLNEGEERPAVVTTFEVDADGGLGATQVFRAWVRSKAKLAYNSVGAWLSGDGPAPAPMVRRPAVAEQIRLQDGVASVLFEQRHERGALDLRTIEPKAVMADGAVVDLVEDDRCRAHEIIEDFMVAANGVTAQFLTSAGYPSFRRVVVEPRRWDRIRRLADDLGERLPADPDPRALNRFLGRRRRADPVEYPDLSLSVVKLLGKGEYAVQMPGDEPIGHFGLAVRDYGHSTAPNRRFPDLITQRLLKAAIAGDPVPYSRDDLIGLAEHCTRQEDAAKKVERQMRKAVAAMVLAPRIGQTFSGIVTGAADKGTWVRLFRPPVEGRLIEGTRGLDVGDRVTVKLVGTDPYRGYIDFVRSNR